MNFELMKSPINWLTVWTMLFIGWLAYRLISRGMAATSET